MSAQLGAAGVDMGEMAEAPEEKVVAEVSADAEVVAEVSADAEVVAEVSADAEVVAKA